MMEKPQHSHMKNWMKFSRNDDDNTVSQTPIKPFPFPTARFTNAKC